MYDWIEVSEMELKIEEIAVTLMSYSFMGKVPHSGGWVGCTWDLCCALEAKLPVTRFGTRNIGKYNYSYWDDWEYVKSHPDLLDE